MRRLSFIVILFALSCSYPSKPAQPSQATWGSSAFEDLDWQAFGPSEGYGGLTYARLWGTPEGPSGILIRATSGYLNSPFIHKSDLTRRFTTQNDSHPNMPQLSPRTTFWLRGGAAHDDSCGAGSVDCIAYFRIHGRFDIAPWTAPNQ